MHIYGPARVHGPQSIGAPHTSRLSRPQAPNPSGAIQDELQISDAGQVIDKVNDLPEIRQDRVDSIRSQIAAGTYETDGKLELALGRLLDEIG
jgi:negative regulator of flagellin synthesis FlgM